jgi:hypothetical protein
VIPADATLGSLESLPDLPPGSLAWILLALGCAWLAMRVALRRGQRARARESGEAPPPGPRWIDALASSRWTLPVLLGLIGVAAAVLVAGR